CRLGAPLLTPPNGRSLWPRRAGEVEQEAGACATTARGSGYHEARAARPEGVRGGGAATGRAP
ncbi:MAG: hypothetical protein ACRDY3_00015, partial [Acidimicrobiales bacterium]